MGPSAHSVPGAHAAAAAEPVPARPMSGRRAVSAVSRRVPAADPFPAAREDARRHSTALGCAPGTLESSSVPSPDLAAADAVRRKIAGRVAEAEAAVEAARSDSERIKTKAAERMRQGLTLVQLSTQPQPFRHLNHPTYPAKVLTLR